MPELCAWQHTNKDASTGHAGCVHSGNHNGGGKLISEIIGIQILQKDKNAGKLSYIACDSMTALWDAAEVVMGRMHQQKLNERINAKFESMLY